MKPTQQNCVIPPSLSSYISSLLSVFNKPEYSSPLPSLTSHFVLGASLVLPEATMLPTSVDAPRSPFAPSALYLALSALLSVKLLFFGWGLLLFPNSLGGWFTALNSHLTSFRLPVDRFPDSFLVSPHTHQTNSGPIPKSLPLEPRHVPASLNQQS